MSNRVISIVLFALALVTFISTSTNTLDPLFLFLADNPLSGALRLAIAASLLAVTFRCQLFTSNQISTILFLGFSLIVFGGASLFSNSMGWALYNYLMPLDSLLLVEAGIIYSLTGLNATAVEKPQTSKPKIYRLQLRSRTT
jgi:hypothetical protein